MGGKAPVIPSPPHFHLRTKWAACPVLPHKVGEYCLFWKIWQGFSSGYEVEGQGSPLQLEKGAQIRCFEVLCSDTERNSEGSTLNRHHLMKWDVRGTEVSPGRTLCIPSQEFQAKTCKINQRKV